ncbi:hypothetical protein V8B97DRAFT_1905126 [Scleroderma yunnanense]
MASFLRFYNAVLIRRPILTQLSTAAVLFGARDIIAQQAIEARGKNYDTYLLRSADLLVMTGAIFGPALTKWYRLLNRIKFSNPTKSVIYRVGTFSLTSELRFDKWGSWMWLDQAILTPVAVAFCTMSILEGKGLPGAAERIRTAYEPTLIRNWAVFIPTQIVNFALVPHHLRFVVVSVVSSFWSR